MDEGSQGLEDENPAGMMVVESPELVDAEGRLGVRPVQDFQKTRQSD